MSTKALDERPTSFKEKMTSSAAIPFPCLIRVPVISTGSSSSANRAQDESEAYCYSAWAVGCGVGGTHGFEWIEDID